MTFSGTSIKYRPLRVGFLVREGAVEDLIKAAGINSVLWGGIHNPLIPVKNDDNSFAKKLIKTFAVDILYAVSETPEITALKAEYPFLRTLDHYAENIFYEDWHSQKQVSGLLDLKNIIDFYWEKEFKTKPAQYKSHFLHLKWEADDPLASVFAIQFGFFPSMNFKLDYEKAFIEGLCAQQKNIISTENTTSWEKSFGVIELTGAELKGYGGGSNTGRSGLYLGKSSNFKDLLSYWNLRAAGINTVYLAYDQLDRAKPFGQSFLSYLNSLPNRHPEIEDWLTFYHRIDDEELIKTLKSEFTSVKRITFNRIEEEIVPTPPEYVFKWQITTTHIEKSVDKYVVNIRLPEMNFLSGQVDDTEVEQQRLAVNINPYGGEYSHPGHTFKIPPIQKLNEFYSRELTFNPWDIRVGKEGFSKIIKPREESILLHPIQNQVLIEKIFETAGIKAKTSQPGLIAKKIIEKIGELEDVRVLKIKGVRMILQNGSPDSSITRGQATSIIKNNDFDKHKGLFIEARNASELDSTSVFDYLLKKDYFRAGLELVCDYCKLSNWLSLKNIDDQWVCEYCGGKNQTSLHLRHRGDWKFRKSGLFAKDNHQEGAIPVLLTLLTIKRISDHSDYIYTTALELKGNGVNCETDFFVMNNNRPGQFLEMCIGECKSEGGLITIDDCEKLKKTAQTLSNIEGGAKVFIVFSKTADNFLPEEIERFKILNKEVSVILLTNRELEPYHPYWLNEGGVDSDVPEKYPHYFADLARNSYVRYLEDNSKQVQETEKE